MSVWIGDGLRLDRDVVTLRDRSLPPRSASGPLRRRSPLAQGPALAAVHR